MANNLILPFAQGAGADVYSDTAWSSVDVLAQGFVTGTMLSGKLNKVLRQSTSVASGFGQFTADWSGVDFSDSLTPINMGANFRIALAAAVAGAFQAADTSATVNVMTASLVPAPPTLTGFIAITIKAANTNTGGVTLNLNGFGNRNVVRRDGSPVQSGDIVQGNYYGMLYDGGNFRLIGVARSEINAQIAAALAAAGSGSGSGTNAVSPTRVLYLTASQNITVQAGETRARAMGWGGGGGGGGSVGNPSGGGGGGGGGFFDAFVTGLTTDQLIAATVGVGGSAGVPSPGSQAGTGGTTSFGAYASTTGGTGGICSQANAIGSSPGGGGTPTLAGGVTGIAVGGNPGGAAYQFANGAPCSGYGGGSPFGGASSPYGGAFVSVSGPGGNFPGGGGGSSVNQANGGVGAIGLLIVFLYP